VSRKARTRAAVAALVLLAVGGALTYGQVSGTFAIFNADVESSNATSQGSWVTGPTGFNTPVASGNGAYFTWTVGNHGVAAQEVYFADQGATSNCTGASYSNSLYSGGTALSNVVASIDGAGSGTSSDVPAANQGDYICYRVRSTNNAWYTDSNVGTAVQVGLVPTGIVFNGAGSGQIASNKTIKITYNHNPAYSSGNVNIVATMGNPGTLSVPGVGTFSGGNITKGGTCTNSTVAASAAILTITLKGCPGMGNTITVTAGGSAAFTGGANVTSTIGPLGHAYSVAQCNVAAPCLTSMAY
jgi:hypothetical protein